MSGPLVAMLTDFGTRDIYVGVMKAVLADIAPDAVPLDLTHAVPPQDIRTGAFQLMCAVEHLPGDTIVLAVVDPGVGGPRRALAVSAGDLTFVAPDNGLISWALARLARRGRCRIIPAGGGIRLGADIQAVCLDRPRFWADRVSGTFHGRDIFAPVAGHLAAGSTLAALGTPTDTIQALPWPAPRTVAEGVVEATIVHVDRFGNLVSSYDGDPHLIRRVSVAGREAAPSANYLSDAPLIALVGSSGLLEVSVPGGDAARALGVGPGAPVLIALAQPAG